MESVTRGTLVSVLEEIVLLLELKGENPFKIRAYRQGAEIVQSYEGDIVRAAAAGELTSVKGIGEALQAKLHELATTGKLDFHQRLLAEFPPSLFELFELNGLGAKKIKVLYEQRGIDSIEALQKACLTGSLTELAGFGKKTVENLLTAIDSRQTYEGLFCHGFLAPLAETLLERLKEHLKVSAASLCGSYRRGKELSHDLDFLVATKDGAALTAYFTSLPEVTQVLSCGTTKASVLMTEHGIQCDLRAVTMAQYPFALQYFTGSKEHNVHLRSLARQQGLSLNEYGLTALDHHPQTKPEGPPIPSVSQEEDLYRALGLDPIVPELRENRGEIEAAQNGELPRLVELSQLRGTFHNHTTASDGKSTLEEMGRAALDHGLEYLGIADHSKSSYQAGGLSEERLLAQVGEIADLNAQFRQEKSGIHLFAGCEVDILKDGSLDFEDDLLAQLDYCVASVHLSYNQEEAEMTKRLLRAMENPHVTMLGHCTGRLLLYREAYPVNLDKVLDCAAETGTIIELNCSYRRADLDWRWWKKARDKGVKCAINPDAHHVDQLQNLAFGIKWARKGWLRKEDVLNTLPLAGIKDYLRHK